MNDKARVTNHVTKYGNDDGVAMVCTLDGEIRHNDCDLLQVGVDNYGQLFILGIEVDDDGCDTLNQTFFSWEELSRDIQTEICYQLLN